MTNPETTNPQTEGIFARVFDRIGMLRKHKDDLLNILNTIEPAGCVISKIQHGSIITRSEYNVLREFIEKRGLHTDVSSVYGGVLSSLDKEKKLNDLNDFTQLALSYPFVVDADEVSEDISRLLENGIAEIWKNGKRGLVKKIELPNGEKGISTLFDHNHSQGGALTFSQDEYHKYGLIEVIKHKVISQDSYNIMFLQREKEPLDRFVRLGGNYHMLQNFDRDGIGFKFGGGPYYYLIYKDISPQGIKIYQIGAYLKSNGDDIRKGFDSFNTFEAEIHKFGKVTFKKSYDDSGKLIGISAFKKKRFGGEEQVRARDKK